MNMLTLTARLRARGVDTPDPPAQTKEVPGVALPHLACTLDTSDTSNKSGSLPLVSESHAVPNTKSAPPVYHSIVHVQGEIDPVDFDFRLALFISHHIASTEAGKLADRLRRRDIESDDRRLCLECCHLSGLADARRCANWRATGMRGPAIPAELVELLQRCGGFDEQTGPAPTSQAVLTDERVIELAFEEDDGDD